MVDLALMAKLVDALPPQARLILLGDKDQLAAVEAGAVFAELCEERGFDAEAAAELQRITGQTVPVETPRSALGDAVVLLTHSHRFAGDSGIGELARRINTGDAAGTLTYISPVPQEPEGCSMEARMAAWYARMDESDRVRVRAEWLAAVHTRDAFETRFRLRWFDERSRWVSSRATPRTAPDGTRSWFGVFTDISRQVELEERLAGIETASSFPSS